MFPNVHSSVNEMFSIVSKLFSTVKRTVSTIRVRLVSRIFYVSSVILYGERNLVLYSLVFSFEILQSLLQFCFSRTRHRCFKRHTNTSILPPYPSMEELLLTKVFGSTHLLAQIPAHASVSFQFFFSCVDPKKGS